MIKYRVIQQIGRGGFCEVYRGYDLKGHRFVAIKKYTYPLSEIKDKVTAEITALRSCSHPNIVKLLEVVVENSEVCLVFELQHATLIQHYKDLKARREKLPQDTIKSYIFQTALALDQLHSNNMMHRDIKPENLMLKRNSRLLKLIDFGFCKTTNTLPHTEYISTRWYRAPELILQMPYGLPVDVFALGCVMLELYNGVEVFRGSSAIDQLYKVCEVLGNFGDWKEGNKRLQEIGVKVDYMPKTLNRLMDKISQEGRDLVERMLVFDPNKRITVKQILRHPYLNDVDLPAEVMDYLRKKEAESRHCQSSLSPRNRLQLHKHRRIVTETESPQHRSRMVTQVESKSKQPQIPQLQLPRQTRVPIHHLALGTPKSLTRIDSNMVIHSDRESLERVSVNHRKLMTSREFRYVRVTPVRS